MRSTPIYKTAAELGVTETMRQALIALARDLADGTVPPERFNMAEWCGTACCLGGHLVQRELPYADMQAAALLPLFIPAGDQALFCRDPLRGSTAVLNFLTLGDPRWGDVMKGACA